MRTLKEIEDAGVGWCGEAEFGRVFDRIRELEADNTELRDRLAKINVVNDPDEWDRITAENEGLREALEPLVRERNRHMARTWYHTSAGSTEHDATFTKAELEAAAKVAGEA